MSSAEKQIARDIKEQMWQLRGSIRAGKPTVVVWVLPGQLACSQRPLRDHPQYGGRGQRLSLEARASLEGWAEDVERTGIRSVICLSHPKELAYYDDALADYGGLLGLYGSMGWQVRHIPWADPAQERTAEARRRVMEEVERIKEDALRAFEELTKPVLMHCSAGIDRSPPVAAYIVCRVGD